jgi:molybdopterin/thiamine biosynthesis adenylyltransferase
MEQGRCANEKDIAVLEEALKELDDTTVAADSIIVSLVRRKQDMPAINAILGGIVANDAVKIVTCKGEPAINQLFLYSLFDGAGWVEKGAQS